MEVISEDDLIHVLHASADGTHMKETKKQAVELLQSEMVTRLMRESMLKLQADMSEGGCEMCGSTEPVLLFNKEDNRYHCVLTELVESTVVPGETTRIKREFVFTWQPMHGEKKAYLDWEEEGGSVEPCTHALVTPEFDEERAKYMTADQVRKLWPRFSGVCPSCGERVVVYASDAHYILGDW